MTLWAPTLRQSPPGPLYQRIADQLERDIGDGLLVAGSRLPTHRDLARRLGVTVVTVTRAYATAAERGLIESTVGRGTFVRDVQNRPTEVRDLDLSTNVVHGGEPHIDDELVARLTRTLGDSYGPP